MFIKPLTSTILATTIALGAGLGGATALTVAPLAIAQDDEVQSIRFCRAGERPSRPGQCLTRGTRPLT